MERAFQPGIQKEFLAILILEFDDVMVKALSCLLRIASSLLFFFAKLLHAKNKYATGEAANRDKRRCRLLPIPHCNITSWFAIGLAEIRTAV